MMMIRMMIRMMMTINLVTKKRSYCSCLRPFQKLISGENFHVHVRVRVRDGWGGG